jgi:ABC-2 type transport system ATP-binding protein
VKADPILAVDGLSRRFGTREIVRSFHLKLEAGERVALVGPNGSGKTTVIRCIAGTLAPSAGKIEINGHLAGTIEARGSTGLSLSHEHSFYLRLTGHENLLFFARLRCRSERQAREQVRALEEELDIAKIASGRVDRCSTGMVQQLAFARALLGEPPLLLLDEPSRSLDEGAFARLWMAIERRENAAALVSTHSAADRNHCDRHIDLPQ